MCCTLLPGIHLSLAEVPTLSNHCGRREVWSGGSLQHNGGGTNEAPRKESSARDDDGDDAIHLDPPLVSWGGTRLWRTLGQ